VKMSSSIFWEFKRRWGDSANFGEGVFKPFSLSPKLGANLAENFGTFFIKKKQWMKSIYFFLNGRP
jgi:hypothetical protein